MELGREGGSRWARGGVVGHRWARGGTRRILPVLGRRLELGVAAHLALLEQEELLLAAQLLVAGGGRLRGRLRSLLSLRERRRL